MVDKVERYLRKEKFGFCQMNLASFYLKQAANKLYVVRVVDEKSGILYDVSKYNESCNNIRNFIEKQTGAEVRLLTIVEAKNEINEELRKVVSGINGAWIYTQKQRQLIVYENQSTDFLGMYEGLSSYLVDESVDKEIKKEIRQKYWTPVTYLLVIANIAVFLVLNALGNVTDPNFMYEHGAQTFQSVLYERQYWRIFTCMFLHFGWEHICANMFSLIFLGNLLERKVGSIRFGAIYLLSGCAAGLVSSLYEEYASVNHMVNLTVSAGASGAIFGIIGALIYRVIQNRKIERELDLRQLMLMAFFSIVSGMMTTGVDNAAHVGGLVFGFLFSYLLAHKR